MAVSSIKEIFQSDVEKVWDIVTNVEKYNTWRSDISKAEVLNESQFMEYTKDGYATNFTITLTDKGRRWEFDMDNSNISGHWTGIFTVKGDVTEIEFIEEVNPKKFIMKPFVKGYLKKQQAQFIADLKKALKWD